MSDSHDAPALDFDRADFSSQDGGHAAPSCQICSAPLSATYYTLGQQMLCEPCSFTARDAWPPGSRFSRPLGAIALGTLAAVIAGLLWLVVTELTGYEIGLIAIVVGLLVGKAVQIGGRAVGGPGYQALAIFLTYSAIVMTYTPSIVAELRVGLEADIAAELEAAPVDSFAPETEAGTEVAIAGAEEIAEAHEIAEAQEVEEAAMTVMLYVIAVPFAYAAPFLLGFDNIIGLLIIAFALYEAWKINKRIQLEFKGPFALGEAEASVG